MNINKNPFTELVNKLSDSDFVLLKRAIEARICRNKIGVGTFDEAALKYRNLPKCPNCNGLPFKDGRSAAGYQRYRCRVCGMRYSSFTETIFEDSKKDLPTWVTFIELMCLHVPIEGIAQICSLNHKTAFEWRHRVFATINNYQNRIVLRDRVWIDETYINDVDLAHGYGEARKRGLFKQKLCIVVAIDVHKNPIAIVCGHGKPTSKKIKASLLSHIKENSIIVHDMEKAHRSLVKAAKCEDEAFKANVNDSLYLQCMSMINNLCSWLKRYLWRFTGMSPKNLQSYLNWYVYLFRVNQAKEKWPKLERVVRHLMLAKTSFRTS